MKLPAGVSLFSRSRSYEVLLLLQQSGTMIQTPKTVTIDSYCLGLLHIDRDSRIITGVIQIRYISFLPIILVENIDTGQGLVCQFCATHIPHTVGFRCIHRKHPQSWSKAGLVTNHLHFALLPARVLRLPLVLR